MHGSTCDDKEVPAISLGESAVAFSDIGRNEKCGAVELINEKAVTSRELFGFATNFIREIHRLLIDEKLLEMESHPADLEEESRAVESRPSRKEKTE